MMTPADTIEATTQPPPVPLEAGPLPVNFPAVGPSVPGSTSGPLRRGLGCATALVSLALVAGLGPLRADTIPVPNGSFESPTTPYADPRIDSWQKTPKPVWYDESGGALWDQLTGQFKNTDPGSADHIDNVDGNQALFLFAVPEVGLFQDYDSTDWSHPTPTHAFDVRFEVGRSYRLTIGAIGGGGNMTNGVTLQLSLYYRDAASNQVTVAATTITNTPAVFTNTTHLIDCSLHVPTVNAGDPWAGQHLGVQLLSTVDPALTGGYWDLDNVRLEAFPEPTLADATVVAGTFHGWLESEPGRFDIVASSDLAAPLSTWTGVGQVTNVTGRVEFTDPATASPGRYYAARAVP